MSRLVRARKKLRRRYLARLATYAQELRVNAAKVPMDLEALRKSAHRLQGSGGTYGFDEITELAGAVAHAPDESIRLHVERLIVACEELARSESHDDEAN